MRGLSDAAARTHWHDGGMDGEPGADAEWAGQVHQHLLHGRDREAAELAVRHLDGAPIGGAPTREGRSHVNANQALWEKGDFTRIAATMRASGEALVDRIGVTEGLEVLDLGCGDGTTAVPAARRGADVLGVDIARNLVEAGNRRAAEEGLANLRFQEGDASDLKDLDDEGFDLVVSIFGAMFAPRPFDVAEEMVRVTRPGGRIVMGNWIPGDPTLVAQILKTSAAYAPPPPEGFVSPMTWGVESEVVERFVAAGAPAHGISFARDTWVFDAPMPPSQLLEVFRDYYGPTMNAFEAAAASGREDALFQELDELFRAQNASPDPQTTSIAATFLRVTVQV
jgi:SAM-dependent methyltransferase